MKCQLSFDTLQRWQARCSEHNAQLETAKMEERKEYCAVSLTGLRKRQKHKDSTEFI